MICNIDAKGRRVRGISGVACLIAGAAMVIIGLVLHFMTVPLVCSGAAILLCGGFQIFESRKGWCVVRALGIKTRI